MAYAYIPNELQQQIAKEKNLTLSDPRYPNMDGEIMTDAAIELCQKWQTRVVAMKTTEDPLCFQSLIIHKKDAAEFMADLRRLKIGLGYIQFWVDLSKGYNDRDGFCETPIYFCTSSFTPDDVTYSLDMGESIIKHYKSFSKDYYKKHLNYDDYHAMEFGVDRYGELVDIPGERDPRYPPIYTEDF